MRNLNEYIESHSFGRFEPKAVLFDMDGVIYDSMGYHATAWHEAMADYGLAMTPQEAYLYEGMRGVETIKLIARQQWDRQLSDEEAERMYAHKSEVFKSKGPAQPMEGIRHLMETIRDKGMGIYVVTGSGQRSLLDKLEADFPGLVYSRNVISSKDVQHGKPSPEPYQAGLRLAGVEPWQAIVVENAPLGVQAAVAAGIFTVAVNTGILPDSALAEKGANMVLHKMAQLEEIISSTFTSFSRA